MGAVSDYLRKVEQFNAPPAPTSSQSGRAKYTRLRRNYDAASVDRLMSAFLGPVTTGDAELRSTLQLIRARSRELERNNDYAKKFFLMCKLAVVGRTGFTLQNKAKDLNGKLDKLANDIIESEWRMWGRKGNCTVDGRLSWVAEQELFIKTVARDGEFLGRKIRGFDNPWRFAIQNLEADLLNESYNRADSQQNLIRMGIEYDAWDRPVAYHLRKKHPGDYFRSKFSSWEYERIPANEIIHCYVCERPTQGRGIPWMHTAVRRLNQVGEYEFAELIAARLGASKMGFYVPNEDGGADIVGDDEDEAGNPITEAEPGIFEKLPSGYKDFKTFMPEHPTTQYAGFIKACLRGVASGLGVAYNSLANDLEGVNFSSMRSGAIEERDAWKSIQEWMVSDFVTQVFEAWLEMLLLTNRTFLPYAKYDKFNAPDFRGRVFDWVDPSKDIDGELKVRRACWKPDRVIVQERFNMDLEDVYQMISEDEALAKKYGIRVDFSGREPAVEQEQEQEQGVQNAQEI